MVSSVVILVMAVASAASVQEGRVCGKCRKVNQPDAKFCGGCGTKVAPPALEPKVEHRACPACKKQNLPDAKFCGGCGKKLVAAPPPAIPKGPAAPVVPKDKAFEWVTGRNKDALNVMPPRFGTRLRMEPAPAGAANTSLLTDRNLRNYVLVKSSVLTAEFKTPVEVDTVALYYQAVPDLGRVRVEGARGRGPFRKLAESGGGPVPKEGICLFEFEPSTVDRIRVTVEDAGKTWLYELMVFEVSTREDRSRSVASRLGLNLAPLRYDGCVMHTTGLTGAVANLIDENPGTGVAMEKADREGISLTFAFAGNQEVLVRAISLVPLITGGVPQSARLPGRIRVFGSTEDPFDAFTFWGTFDVRRDRPLRFELPPDSRARFVRIDFDPAAGEKIVSVGEVEIVEGAGRGYESLAFREQQYVSLRRDGPTGVKLVPDGGTSAAEKEPNDEAAKATAVDTGVWITGDLGQASDRDTYRFITLPDEEEVAVLDLRMNPFLRATARILDLEGKEITRLDLQRVGGSVGEFPISVPAGAYLLELTASPVYVLLVCDTSASMSGTFRTTGRALREWADRIPPGFHIATANSSTRDEFKLVTPYTKDAAPLKDGLKSMFASGSSSWYTMIYRGLAYGERYVPPDAVAAAVLLADGNGSGQFRKMWSWLRETRCRLYTIGYGGVGQQMDATTSWNGRRGLFNVAWYRGGRYYEPKSNTQLVETYGRIFADLATPPRYAFRIRTRRREPGILETQAIKGEVRPVHFILDASGTMMAEAGDRTRLEAAKEVISRMVATLPPETPVGLRVYGHRYRTLNRERASRDSELLVPIGKLNAPAFRARLARVRAIGGTPLAYSLLQARGDLGSHPRPRVVLITDGVEGFRGKPILAARALTAGRPGMSFAVVGFAIGRLADQQNLRGMAAAGRGTYYDAEDAGTLIRAVEQAVRPRLPYVILDTVGKEIARGQFGDRHVLPEGTYTCVVAGDGGERRIPFGVRRGRTTRVFPPKRD